MVFWPEYTSLELGIRHDKTTHVVFDEESEFSGPRTPKLSSDQVVEENVPNENLLFNMLFSFLVFFNPLRKLF